MSAAALQVVSRIAASIFGGYVFVWGFTTLAITLGVAAGMRYVEARTLAFLLAFLVFLACFCWSYAAFSATRVWAVLAGGGALMTGAAWYTMRALL